MDGGGSPYRMLIIRNGRRVDGGGGGVPMSITRKGNVAL